MSDARSLLRAKRQEVRVNHPLASYTLSGQLRCIACRNNIKQGTSWEGHIGSKQHRTSAQKLKEEEQRRTEEALARQKRKAEDEDEDDEGVELKRRRVHGRDEDEDEAVPDHAGTAKGDFPTDFFSDPSRPLPPPSDEDTDDEGPPAGNDPAPAPALQAKSAIDEEWERFQEAVVNAPDLRETYERATVFAEPVLAPTVPEGFPLQATGADDAGSAEGSAGIPDEAELRKRREQDERELIMDRLLEEERAQEEADAKVSLLKSRLEALKRQREAKRIARTKAPQKGQ